MNPDQTRTMWTMGDYRIVGDWIASASLASLRDLELQDARLLDVACGTGTVAIEAARRGASVVALDLTPSMLDVARSRAAQAQLSITWREQSFTEIEDRDTFDLVTSGFGVIFAGEESSGVMGRMLRACRAGGIISLTAWHPRGAFSMPDSILALMELEPPPHGPEKWATRQGLEQILAQSGETYGSISLIEDTIPMRFASVEDALEQLLEYSGPWKMVFGYLQQLGRGERGLDVLRSHLDDFARDADGGGIVFDADYTIARITAAP